MNMDLNPRNTAGLDNIHKFLWTVSRANLITEHERNALLSLRFRLQRHYEGCVAPYDSRLRHLILQADVAQGMQVALVMSCEFIRDRAKGRLKETQELIESVGQAVALQEGIVSAAGQTLNTMQDALRNAKQTRDALKELV